MYSFRRLSAIPLAIFLLAGAGTASRAQSATAVTATARISSLIEPRETTRLTGHVPAWASAANDLGSIPANRHLDNLHLILSRAPHVQAAFEQLLADQQNPASSRFHQWLTPQQNAARYGIAASDLSAVTGWLRSQGLTVDNVAAGGVFITFSGPASVVENAFSTTLHSFLHENAARYAPTAEPAIPAALAGVIQSVGGLAEQMAHVQSLKAPAETTAQTASEVLHPLYNSGSSGAHYISPGDFNTIYDINPTHNAGFTGSGFRVANLIDSRIAPADITGFNAVFGLSVAEPNQIVLPGSTDPGITADSEGEAALDVQRILGTAPGATVDLVVFSSLSFTNIYSALQYEISTLNDPVVNMSFGSCDSGAPASYAQRFDSYFQTGAAQGISFFVSSGDNAAAGCDGNYTSIPAKQLLSTNILCASGYATCVGGTEFAETSGSDWSGSNSSTRVSATGYIPEGAWNEPTSVSNGKTTYQASGTGGGVTVLPKPAWQTGTGVPADGSRDVPDVSFTSSYHDGYLICQVDIGNDCSSGIFKYIIFGTSASSPSMAGIAALLDQELNARQGNLNPLFYKLAATPSNSVFHDVTAASSGVTSCATSTPSMCNNSTPSATSLTGGLAGYAVATGYDLATGLGSLDVANFLTAATPTATTVATSLALTASANPITTAQTVSFTASLAASGAAAPTGTVQFYSNGVPLGSAAALAPASASGSATSAALNFPTAGTYAITAVYTGDATFLPSTSATLSLVVTAASTIPPSFTITAAPTSLVVAAGATTNNTEAVTLTSVGGFAGTVSLSCAISAGSATSPPTCAIAPATVTLAAGGAATAAAKITSSAPQTAARGNLGLAAGGTMFAGLLCLLPFRRRRAVRPIAAVLVLFSALATLSGCGSGGALLNKTTLNSSAGTYIVTVSGTAAATGSSAAATHSATFTLTIN